ncbi:MAG TPA: 23S rRNA (adenine(2503)-C2)-methyltransferase [Spirochaetaceae bacterium]|nr:23S rRNA (adenine(2503)-C2)-methyltransferase [Spirochaetaceae bacterium]
MADVSHEVRFPSIFSVVKEGFDAAFPFAPAYRFSQLRTLRMKGYDDIALYKTLGKYTVSFLEKAFPNGLFSSQATDVADSREATKIIVRLRDGSEVESVFISPAGGKDATACLSSQVGCNCKCSFCSTASIPFVRNLEDYEIVEQFYHLKRICGQIRNIVFMGMGEPLLNLNAVISAAKFFLTEEGLSARNITVSTSGITSGIYDIANKFPEVKLAFSIVCADESKRRELVPVSKANPLTEVKKALLKYQSKNRRRITLAYPLFAGVNDFKSDAVALKAFAAGLICHVNLIPFNEGGRGKYKRPSDAEIKRFERFLDNCSISHSVRYSKGGEVNGACGELALKRSK